MQLFTIKPSISPTVAVLESDVTLQEADVYCLVLAKRGDFSAQLRTLEWQPVPDRTVQS